MSTGTLPSPCPTLLPSPCLPSLLPSLFTSPLLTVRLSHQSPTLPTLAGTLPQFPSTSSIVSLTPLGLPHHLVTLLLLLLDFPHPLVSPTPSMHLIPRPPAPQPPSPHRVFFILLDLFDLPSPSLSPSPPSLSSHHHTC